MTESGVNDWKLADSCSAGLSAFSRIRRRFQKRDSVQPHCRSASSCIAASLLPPPGGGLEGGLSPREAGTGIGVPQWTTTVLKGFGIRKRSQLFRIQARFAEMATGTIGTPESWAMLMRPALMTPRGPRGPSTRGRPGVFRKVRDHRGEGLPAASRTRSAHRAEVEPTADVRDHIPIPALADHHRGREFAEAPCVGEDEEYPLMPDGGDRLPALMEVLHDRIFTDGTDADQAEIEADDRVEDGDQAVFDGESGETFDHGMAWVCWEALAL